MLKVKLFTVPRINAYLRMEVNLRSLVLPGKCRDSTLNSTTTVSFHILSSSSFPISSF
jgi:hypothetical protein